MTIDIGMLLFPRSPSSTSPAPSRCFTAFPRPRCTSLWKDLEPVRADSGLRIVPTTTPRRLPDARRRLRARRHRADGADGRRGGARLPRGPGEGGALRHVGVHRLAPARRRRAPRRLRGDDALGVHRSLAARSARAPCASASSSTAIASPAAASPRGSTSALRIAAELAGEEAAQGDPARPRVRPRAALPQRPPGRRRPRARRRGRAPR